jgi:sterol desaturase/sphingolipid hydroxylase (fatty acid hydroxylase superfamily)
MTAPTLSLALLAGLPLGAVLWTFMEYVLHRFAFHEARGKNYGSREHLRHHGSDDTVLESWYLSWAGVLLVSLALIPFLGRLAGLVDLGWGVGLGYLVGYGFYDLIHWRAHRRPIASAYEAQVRKHHFIHHFHAPLKNHGVTTPFWDHVFGTHVEVERVRVPRRMAMRWLVDEHGEVRPEYADTYELRGSRHLDADRRDADRELAFANQAPIL